MKKKEKDDTQSGRVKETEIQIETDRQADRVYEWMGKKKWERCAERKNEREHNQIIIVYFL